jgi:DNA-binding transcriptional MerR regulator
VSARLRIGALEERTGLTRDTIHHYVREGLVHAPEKTGATVAWYDQKHVTRLRAIRALRCASLPLAAVKRLLSDPSIAAMSVAELEALGRSLASVGLREVPRATVCDERGRALAAKLRIADRVDENPALADALTALVAAVSPENLAVIEASVMPALRALAASSRSRPSPSASSSSARPSRAIDAAAPAGRCSGATPRRSPSPRSRASSRDPSRLVGMHFFNPVPVMELLEVVRGAPHRRRRGGAGAAPSRSASARRPSWCATSRASPPAASAWPLGAEAIRMLEQGVASAEDIDRAMELGYRHPMGPLKLTDLVGLDVRLAILDHLHREVGEQFRPPALLRQIHRELGEQFRPPALLRQMVRAGKLGKKSGEGFYRRSTPASRTGRRAARWPGASSPGRTARRCTRAAATRCRRAALPSGHRPTPSRRRASRGSPRSTPQPCSAAAVAGPAR